MGKKKKNPDVGGREWEGGSRGRGHIYTYGRFKLLFSKNQHNTVEQLCVCTQLLSCAQLFASPWTVARQDPLSMEFSRQEYWSGLPFPSPGDLPDPGIKPESPELASRFFTTAAAKSLQSCPTLCDPIDGSPPSSAVPGILQARTLEWVAISFSSA